MKPFHCSHCGSLVFFENVLCLSCGQKLAYLPDVTGMAAVEPGEGELWNALGEQHGRRPYRLCANYQRHDICNWAIPASDDAVFCGSCRLTRVIPDVDVAGNKEAWYRLEVAKRRLLYTINGLGLPLHPIYRDGDGGIAFEFKQDVTDANGDVSRVLTGHDNGVITINVAEADDLSRERERLQHNEPYRTLVGHFRHESGHYFWDRLIQGGTRLEEFRATFGDERADYAAALSTHYQHGAPPDWEQRFISAYASTHPWEDWAETWAHYLHMTDALETASAAGLSLRPPRDDEPRLSRAPDPLQEAGTAFSRMMSAWFSLTYVLNSLSRGLGRADHYPFVLSTPVVDKLRFVHEIVQDARYGPTGHSDSRSARSPLSVAPPASYDSRAPKQEYAMSTKTHDDDMKHKTGGSERGGSGNFAQDPQRASEAGKKGARKRSEASQEPLTQRDDDDDTDTEEAGNTAPKRGEHTRSGSR